MIAPRYSLIWLLVITAVAAVLALLIAWALRGNVAAYGVVGAILCALVSFGMYSLLFLVNWLMSLVVAPDAIRRPTGSPFAAADRPPPQILAPEEFD